MLNRATTRALPNHHSSGIVHRAVVGDEDFESAAGARMTEIVEQRCERRGPVVGGKFALAYTLKRLRQWKH